MASTGALVMMCAVLAFAAVMVGEAAVTCNDVTKNLAPCLIYLQKGGTVPTNCCGGVKALFNAATTKADRQTACNCMKSTAAGIPSISVTFASQLPRKCGVNIPYPISPNTDCSIVR